MATLSNRIPVMYLRHVLIDLQVFASFTTPNQFAMINQLVTQKGPSPCSGAGDAAATGVAGVDMLGTFTSCPSETDVGSGDGKVCDDVRAERAKVESIWVWGGEGEATSNGGLVDGRHCQYLHNSDSIEATACMQQLLSRAYRLHLCTQLPTTMLEATNNNMWVQRCCQMHKACQVSPGMWQQPYDYRLWPRVIYM